jgi:ArsR family transcriptional regulator
MQSLKDRSISSKAKIFKALGDPIRLEIIEFLRDGEKCVCDIVMHVGIIQPLVSRHLAILKSCGIINDRKKGNRRLYSITDPRIFMAIDAITPELIDALLKRVIEQLV